MATIAEAADHIVMSETRFKQLLDQGVLNRRERNGYDLKEVREAYIRYARLAAQGRAEKKPGNLDLAEERAKLVEQQTETAAFKLAVSRGEYVLAKEVTAASEAVNGVIREKILTRSGKLTDALTMRERSDVARILHAEDIEILNELCDPITYIRVAGSLEGDADLSAASRPQSDSMGGHLPVGSCEDVGDARALED